MMGRAGIVLSAIVVALAAAFMFDGFDPSKVKGKKIIITGASMGIGEHLALEYSKLGAEIVIIARTKAKLEKVAGKCEQLGGKVHVLPADLSSQNDTTFKEIIDESVNMLGGKVDTLLLNHVVTIGAWMPHGWLALLSNDSRPRGVDDDVTPMGLTRWIFDTNTFSFFSMANHALPYLMESKGNIVAVSSAAGKMGIPKAVPYSASKHALHGYFDSLRLELALENIDVGITTCTIGSVDTENALENVKGGAPVVTFYPASECAKAILRGSETRVRQVFYPFFQTYPSTILYPIMPTLMDILIRNAVPKA